MINEIFSQTDKNEIQELPNLSMNIVLLYSPLLLEADLVYSITQGLDYALLQQLLCYQNSNIENILVLYKILLVIILFPAYLLVLFLPKFYSLGIVIKV